MASSIVLIGITTLGFALLFYVFAAAIIDWISTFLYFFVRDNAEITGETITGVAMVAAGTPGHVEVVVPILSHDYDYSVDFGEKIIFVTSYYEGQTIFGIEEELLKELRENVPSTLGVSFKLPDTRMWSARSIRIEKDFIDILIGEETCIVEPCVPTDPPPPIPPPIGEGEYYLPLYGMGSYDYSCHHWNCPSGGTCNSVDIFAGVGRPLLAVTDGTMIAKEYSLGGHTVTINGDDGISYYYAHMRDPGTSRQVKKGEIVGYVGLSGSACKPDPNGKCTGAPHLHFSATTNNNHNLPNIWVQGLFEAWGYFVGKCP